MRLRRSRILTPLVFLVSLGFVGAACSSGTEPVAAGGGGSTTAPAAGSTAPGPGGGSVSGTITVSAAASLTEPFKRIGADFQKAHPAVTEVKFNFDSSSTLARQIQDGAPVDSFASADEANMKKLTEAQLVAGSPTVFARNKLTIVVKKGNPQGVTSLADLASVGTVSLCGPEVPCGKYADQILSQAGVTIPADKVTRGQNVKATLAAVAEGDAEAGIVYLTDVTAGVDRVEIPDQLNVIATYPIAVINASGNRSTAQAFIDYVVSPAGQAVLGEAGFLPPR